jgi:ABC-type transport system substrate-binding protein
MRNLLRTTLVLLLGLLLPVAALAEPKTLRVLFEAPDSGLDGALTVNWYSAKLTEMIFERLLTYDYMARPAKLVAGTAEAMPEVKDGGKTYVFHIRKGIYFTPDPAFKGKRRELTAADYIYSFERILDPQNRSPLLNFLSGKIVGLDAQAARAEKSGHFDYDAPVAGLKALDRYTLRIELNAPDYNFPYVMAMPAGMGAVAREAIDAYPQQTRLHPVGTGPYMLAQYVPSSKIVLAKNPDFRGLTWDFSSEDGPNDAQIVKDMRGKRLPQIDRIEVSIIQEEQSRWLAFADKQLDLDFLPQLAAPKVMDGDRLKPEYAKAGIHLDRAVDAGLTYTLFNMTDPVVGGYTREKIALRRAIAMSYDTKQEIALIRNGQAVPSQMAIPPGVAGYDPNYRSSIPYDIDLANRLLDHFGYKRGADGWRTMPDGKPLVVSIAREPAAVYTEIAELWQRGLDKLGIHSEHPVSSFQDHQQAALECKLMMWGAAWNADYPDGENFLQQLYGPNALQGNMACYRSPAFDAIYKQAMARPAGPERYALYAKMNRQMEADTPWFVQTVRVRNWVSQPWVLGFKKHPILNAEWLYMDVVPRDVAQREVAPH